MIQITPAGLRERDACWDDDEIDAVYAAHGVEAFSPLEILALDEVPAEDRLWVVLDKSVIPRRPLRLLACDYAEHVLPIWEAEQPDDMRPWAAIAVARRYAVGDAGRDELAAARAAARAAVGGAAGVVAAAGAVAAVWAAAGGAAEAGAAAWAAVWVAAGDVARDAEQQWQIQRTVEVLTAIQAETEVM